MMRAAMTEKNRIINCLLALCLLALAAVTQGCVSSRSDTYRDNSMDFGSVKTVAIMPLVNLSREQQASDRVRDVFSNALLSSGAVYVTPTGEVSKGITVAGMANPGNPSIDETVKFCKAVKADAIIVGTIREYGELKSGSATANVVSLSLQLIEGQTGKVVWSSATTVGGIGMTDRLLGGGGQPLNTETEKAAHALINKLFE
jgi:polysaccharide biosynthesis protein PelC